MQIELSVRIYLDATEQFKATERHRGTDRPETTIVTHRIVTHRIAKTELSDESLYCHGPKVLKSGKLSTTQEGCVVLRAEALPIPLLEKIQAALVPHLAVREEGGSEAARQSALG